MSTNNRSDPSCVCFYVIAAKLYADMTESWSRGDVDNAITAIRVFLTRVGTLPQVLSNAYRHEIKIGELEVTRRFYEQLAINCPDALDYFTESTDDVLAIKNNRPKSSLRKIPVE